MSPPRRRFVPLLLSALMAPAAASFAALDLERVVRERLDNGLTLLILEEPALPLVSVQMLYRVGARDEVTGRTGLAHFVEHMAFRASANFPRTELVSRIYAVGGEWHGYTWIDQTTYYATVPRDELDLLLDIEADRMARLLLPAAEIEVERGAVLAELYGYKNDPAVELKDAVLATSFLHHPYRHNTIGWPSDVERITHTDVEAFYRAHYRPANAVLAVVGDVEVSVVQAAVRARFAALAGGAPTPLPRTVEPPQRGERRVTLRLPRGLGRFEIAYRAPAATSPDYPAFLVLQELLGGSGGVNFDQDTFGTPIDGSLLLGRLADDVVTWFPPSALPYVFTVSGDRGERAPEEVERSLEDRLARLRNEPLELTEAAREALLEQLVFDVETTEDAAHQLAFFEGLGALDVLLALPERVAGVTPEDVRRVAATYLQPWQRTIGWIEPASEVAARVAEPTMAGYTADSPGPPTTTPRPEPRASNEAGLRARIAPVDGAPAPITFELSSGLPVVFQRSTLSATGYLLALFPHTECGAGLADGPLWRHSSYGSRFLLRHAWRTFRGVPHLVRACAAADSPSDRAAAEGGTGSEPESEGARDPDAELDRSLRRLLGLVERPLPAARPRLLVLAGDLDEAEARRLSEESFGDVAPAEPAPGAPPRLTGTTDVVTLGGLAQARLGWAVPAPPPSDPAADAWRMLLYILTHDYEGRLGVEAISRRGLVYHIASEYHCDGGSAWISLATGVDPGKLAAMRELLSATLAGLAARPPTDAEIEEARRHLYGRRLTAAQSNREIAERLARDWVCHGEPLSAGAYLERLERVGRDDILAAIPEFVRGAVAVVQ